jgi:hypothetical protein
MVCANRLGLNPNRPITNIIKFITNNFLQHALDIGYNRKYAKEESVYMRFLGFTNL